MPAALAGRLIQSESGCDAYVKANCVYVVQGSPVYQFNFRGANAPVIAIGGMI